MDRWTESASIFLRRSLEALCKELSKDTQNACKDGIVDFVLSLEDASLLPGAGARADGREWRLWAVVSLSGLFSFA